MAKNEEAEALASVLARVLNPIVERLERLEAVVAPKEDGATSPDELHFKLMASLRGQDQEIESIGLVEIVHGCMSDTGATFDAEVHYPPLKRGGRVVGKDPKKPIVKVLLNYTWPEGIDKHVADGGLVPDGMDMKELSGMWVGQETDNYRQWKYDEFTKADARRYVGKPLPSNIRRVTPPVAPVAQTA